MGRFLEPLLIVFWLAVIACGLRFALDFEKRPTPMAQGNLKCWPAASKLTRQANSMTLLMFVHPNCPCSQASLAELSRFLDRNKQLCSYVCFFVPENADKSWLGGRNWQSAMKIPGLKSVADHSSREAGLFNARSSGETFLFAADGNLLFHGGITAARGHEGPNSGLEQLQLATSLLSASQSSYPVYGCGLLSRSEAPRHK